MRTKQSTLKLANSEVKRLTNYLNYAYEFAVTNQLPIAQDDIQFLLKKLKEQIKTKKV